MKSDRNAPCPCGSGRKFKRCCSKDVATETAARAVGLPSIECAYEAFTHGDMELANREIQALLNRFPNHPDGNHLAGLICAQMGRFDLARDFIQRASNLSPNNAFVHSNLCMVLRELTLVDAAVQAGLRATKIDSTIPDAQNNLANALKDKGDLQGAISHYRQAILLDPNNEDFLKNLSSALLLTGQLGAVEDLWIEYLKRVPQSVNGYIALGEVAVQQKRWEAAHAWFMKAAESGTRDPSVFDSLALVLQELRNFPAALEQFKRSLTLDPGNARVWYECGCLLEYCENLPAALRAYQEAHALGLRAPALQLSLLSALVAQGELDRAHALAVTLLPEADRYTRLLPALIKTFGLTCDFDRLQDAWLHFDSAFTDNRMDLLGIDMALMLSNYPDFIPEQRLWDYHRVWGERTEAAAVQLPARSHARPDKRKIRLGYISPDFQRHSVGFFIQHVLAHHDHNVFEVYAYCDSRVRDQVTEYIQKNVDQFVSIHDISYTDVVARVQADEIDILIDLASHTHRHRLSVFACRPAPLAMTWIGYLNTSGMKSIDYRITDVHADPEEGVLGTEQLLRLPHSFLCFGEFPNVAIAPSPPCQRHGYVTFGSFNNLLKLNRSVIRAWARVLTQVNGSRLVIMGEGSGAGITQRFLEAEFKRHGIDEKRIELRKSLAYRDYLAFHNEVDMLLDTFPFNGGTVTANALWMGVPVVTLVGAVHRQRVTYSILRNIGVEDTIAWDEADFVARAVALARDPDRLAALRRTIPEAIRASILCDARRFTREFETSLLELATKHHIYIAC